MAFTLFDIAKQRKKFKQDLKSGKLIRLIGSFSPLVSKMIEKIGFEGIYISGAVISSDLAWPDLELHTLSELISRGRLIIQTSSLPSLIDIDCGFGSSLNVARSTIEAQRAGFCGLHLEDQKSPKKCGHLDNKKLISIKEMQEKIKISLKSRTDPLFLISARTDARGVEGLDGAIQRARAYQEAGAEMIFPEALENREEFEQFRQKIDVPLIANMTEFGKSELLSCQTLEKIGINIALYPVSAWRLALKAVERGLESLHAEGCQKHLLSAMLNRKELYKLLNYSEYENFLSYNKLT